MYAFSKSKLTEKCIFAILHNNQKQYIFWDYRQSVTNTFDVCQCHSLDVKALSYFGCRCMIMKCLVKLTNNVQQLCCLNHFIIIEVNDMNRIINNDIGRLITLTFTIKVAGDQSILVVFGETINIETNRSVRQLAELIETHNIPGIMETILGYTNVLINYDPMKLPYKTLVTIVEQLVQEIDPLAEDGQRTINIPVLYGAEWGPDLPDVAKINGLTEEEVIRIHTEPSYLVYFLGFTPGFPFLGGMSTEIATPRLATPRTRIPGGSVGIANDQTGIYPVSSPGGWRLIGHTPVALYDTRKDWPFLLAPGDQIKFTPVTKSAYENIKHKVKNNTYDVKI